MDVIVDRCVRIDVEIQIEMEELEEMVGKEGGGDDDVFELDPFDIVVGDGEDASDNSDDEDVTFSDLSDDEGHSDEEGEELPTNLIHVHEMTTKLDGMLYLVYDHFQSMLNPPAITATTSVSVLPPLPEDLLTPTTSTSLESVALPILSPPHLLSEFTNLLSIFDRTILLTYKSRYTQFLLFYITSLDARFSDLFMGMLVERALFAGVRGSTARGSASSYIGSFVSRAKFVGKEEVRRIVGVLLSFLASAQEDGVDMGKEEKTVVYSVCGAMFLIFCFRWRDLKDDDDDEEGGKAGWMRNLSILKAFIKSGLNPLKVSIIKGFL
jgi:RNA polymerase I-specific transcription initiation factor RRN3